MIKTACSLFDLDSVLILSWWRLTLTRQIFARNLILFLYPDDRWPSRWIVYVSSNNTMVSNGAQLIIDEVIKRKLTCMTSLADYAWSKRALPPHQWWFLNWFSPFNCMRYQSLTKLTNCPVWLPTLTTNLLKRPKNGPEFCKKWFLTWHQSSKNWTVWRSTKDPAVQIIDESCSLAHMDGSTTDNSVNGQHSILKSWKFWVWKPSLRPFLPGKVQQSKQTVLSLLVYAC